MNKKVLIIGAVILLLLVAGYFLIFAKKGTAPVGTSAPTSSAPKSLKDLLGLGTAQKCTFSTKTDSGESSGTVYVAGGSMRGDFTSAFSGKTSISHMITADKVSYTWIDGEKTGYKMTFNPDEASSAPATGTAAPKTTPQTSGGPDLNQASDYSCSSWVADSSLFTPPTEIKFMSLESLVPTAKPVK